MRGFEIVSQYKSNKDFKIPERSTIGSAGYDFYLPEDVTIPSNWECMCIDGQFVYIFNSKPKVLYTGIKAYMEQDEVLELYPRSSSAIKHSLVCANSVSIIDSDYYNNPTNEGEIAVLLYNLSLKDVNLYAGDRICQGIFKKYLVTDKDNVTSTRTGGMGSTDY